MERRSNILGDTLGYGLRSELSKAFGEIFNDKLEEPLRTNFYNPVCEQDYWTALFYQLRFEDSEDEAV